MKKKDFELDFIGIGAEKAGSSWVASILEDHPEVCLSHPKEVQYFNNNSSYTRGKNKNFNKKLSWYKKHFQHCNKKSLKGEFSTIYLYDEKAPTKIKEILGEMKIVVCFRDPIDRLYSQYWMYRNYFREEKRSFEEVIEKEPEYIEKSMYYKQLKKYLDIFSIENFLFIILDEIKANPEKVARNVYKFLELKDVNFKSKNLCKKRNVAKKVRFIWVLKFMKTFSSWMVFLKLSWILKFLIKLNVKKFLIRISSEKTKYPLMDKSLREKLLPQFLDDLEKLERVIDKDLSSWKK